MKVARFVLKIVGWSLAVAAAACCIVAYWDKIADGVACLRDKCGCTTCADFDDYADWDE